MYYAKIIADSESPRGHRLTSVEVRYPHAVHKDIMTHCVFDRNFLSFRAWPPERVIQMVAENGFIPEVFYKRSKGMEHGEPFDDNGQDLMRAIWVDNMNHAVITAQKLLENDVDKSQINFLLQDYCWITGIISATEWDNFFALRAFAPEGSKPRPEVEKIARLMYNAREESNPVNLGHGEWHLPYVPNELRSICTEDALKKISAGRCARISYLTHDGKNDIVADVGLAGDLVSHGHMSPYGHQARPIVRGTSWDMETHGKFRGWVQARKLIANESNFKLVSGAKF